MGNRINRVSVVCQDTQGFLVNRLIYPYIFEAIRLHGRGNASIKDIGNGMKLGADYPMGPFVVADLIGLDVCKQVLDGWRELEPKKSIVSRKSTFERDGELRKIRPKGWSRISRLQKT